MNTPNLWFGDSIYNLQQFEIECPTQSHFNQILDPNLRLGKRVEQFVFNEFQEHPELSILAKNLQIQKDKQTLGEMDLLFLYKETPCHLEIIYKFYVYDASVGSTPLDHWIGPNRKDSLVHKLDKLKNKQLPLLHSPETLKYLKKFDIIDSALIKQFVLFKAQLFLPYRTQIEDFKDINPACMVGYYLKKKDLVDFKACKFFIPSKVNWLQEPQTQVNWMPFYSFRSQVNTILEKQTSPLVWIKHPKGEIKKYVVVWWQ